MTVKELIDLLEKENPDAEIKISFDKEIKYVYSIGGNSFLTNQVRISDY
jgi:hypothetical protein